MMSPQNYETLSRPPLFLSNATGSYVIGLLEFYSRFRRQ